MGGVAWVRATLWSFIAFLSAFALGTLAGAAVTSFVPNELGFDAATAVHEWTGRFSVSLGIAASLLAFWWVYRKEPADKASNSADEPPSEPEPFG